MTASKRSRTALTHRKEEVVDFFQTTIKYYQEFPTFDFLADHDIHPSNKTTYTLHDIEAAVEEEIGGKSVYFGCSGPRYNETAAGRNTTDNGRINLSEAWYYFHVRGRPQDFDYELTPKTGPSNCAVTKGGNAAQDWSLMTQADFLYSNPLLRANSQQHKEALSNFTKSNAYFFSSVQVAMLRDSSSTSNAYCSAAANFWHRISSTSSCKRLPSPEPEDHIDASVPAIPA